MPNSVDVLEMVADAFKKGGIEAAYNFPGFHSHKLFDYMGGIITSTNEKIAYELAWGSSQAGKKTLVTFKNVGLNDAADPFINSMLTGAGAGLVLAVLDDTELEGSQCILDSRHYFDFYGGLWLEPFDLTSAQVLAEAAPGLSYIFDVPVVLRLTNSSLKFTHEESHSFVSTERIIELAACFAGTQFTERQAEPLVHPVNGEKHLKLIEKKQQVIQRFVDELHRLVNIDGIKGNVYCGYSEHKTDSHIITLPVPSKGIGQVRAVYEVGNGVVAEELTLQIAGTKFASNTLGYNPENANHYIITPRYERLMRLLKQHYKYVVGDLGEYTKDTLHTITHCLCFGSASSVATGMCEAGKEALAITGDGSFFHSGKNVLTEAKQRGVACKVVLIDNGGSQGSGGQKIPGAIPSDVDLIEIDLDKVTDAELEEAVNTLVTAKTVTILKVNHKF